MTAVRIRHASQADAVPLADVPFDRLDDALAVVRRWGVVDTTSEDLVGQFVIGDTVSYFEIVAGEGDD